MAQLTEYCMRPGPLTRDPDADRNIYLRRLRHGAFAGQAFTARVNPLARPWGSTQDYEDRARQRLLRSGSAVTLYAVDHTDTHGVWAFYTAAGRRYAVAPTLEELLRNAEQDGILYPTNHGGYARSRWANMRMPRRRQHRAAYARDGFING